MSGSGHPDDQTDRGADPSGRLLFWLRVPYLADLALVLIGIGLLLAGRPVGWWVLVFAVVHAIIGTIALLWLAPRMISRRRGGGGGEGDPREPDGRLRPHR